MNNPMYQKIAFSLIRYALIAGGAEGLMADNDLSQAIGAVSTLIALGWSIRKNFKERQTLVTALKVADVSENDVKLLVKDPKVATPSVSAPKDMVPV